MRAAKSAGGRPGLKPAAACCAKTTGSSSRVGACGGLGGGMVPLRRPRACSYTPPGVAVHAIADRRTLLAPPARKARAACAKRSISSGDGGLRVTRHNESDRGRTSAAEPSDIGPGSTIVGLDEDELAVLRHVGGHWGRALGRRPAWVRRCRSIPACTGSHARCRRAVAAASHRSTSGPTSKPLVLRPGREDDPGRSRSAHQAPR